MARLSQEQIEYLLLDAPVVIGQEYGFNKLTDLHNEWIVDMVLGQNDDTLQGHRGSYKTTCISIALADIIVAFPYDKIMFSRKTDDDVKEIVAQTKKILLSDVMQSIVISMHGEPLKLTTDNATEINTSLCANDPRGTSQLVGYGIGSSVTGKHFDRIFTDDIVNLKDRASRAEREKTKKFYQELHNIKNRGGRIFNTGTPWHKDDAFSIMPNARKYDCYTTGLISEDEIVELKENMEGSLFAANYELKHIASDDILFSNPQTGADSHFVEHGSSHVDASYGGSDSTAFTILNYHDGNIYVLGKMWHKHVDDCLDDIVELHNGYMAWRIHNEDNGDKGYLNKELKKRGLKTRKYHEGTNKYLKISSVLKPIWKKIIFVEGTDEEYINQVCDYNENAEHDDAPDSLASLIRDFKKKSEEDAKELMFL